MTKGAKKAKAGKSPGEPVLVFAAIAAALAMRAYPLGTPTFQDPDHYYHLRQMEYVAQNGAVRDFDELSNMGRPYTYYPAFHLLGGSLSALLGIGPLAAYLLASSLAIALSVVSIYCLAKKILEKAGVGGAGAVYAGFFASAMPAFFIRQTVFSRPDAFAPAIFCAALLCASGGKIWPMAVLGGFAALLHPYSFAIIALLLAVALAAQALAKKLGGGKNAGKNFEKTMFETIGTHGFRCLALFALSGIFAASYYLRLPLSRLGLHQAFQTSAEMQPPTAANILQLFGPALVFEGVALYELFRQKNFGRAAAVVAVAAASMALFLVANRNIIYACAPNALLAALGASAAREKTGKYSVYLWVVVGLSLIATAFASSSSASGQYTAAQGAGFRYLGGLPFGPVAALWDRGHAITHISRKPVVADGYFEFEPRLDEKAGDIARIFNSASAGELKSIAGKYGVRYLFFDNRTRTIYYGADNPFYKAFSIKPV